MLRITKRLKKTAGKIAEMISGTLLKIAMMYYTTAEANAAINPAAIELCDNLDNDCDVSIDEDLGQTTCGFGECQRIVDNCLNGLHQECEPGIPTTEVCDGLDNNCDGAVDESACFCGDGIISQGELCEPPGHCCGEVTANLEPCCNEFCQIVTDCGPII